MPASSASEKLALGKQYTNMLSLLTDCQATSSPFRLYFHLNVSFFLSFPSLLHVPLVPFSPCHMQIFPLAEGMEKRGSSSKAQVRVNLGSVVFLLEGFRKMKDGECTQDAALCYKGLPVAQTLNPYEQKKKENIELKSWETGNRKAVNICLEPRTRGLLLCFSRSGGWRSQKASHSQRDEREESPLRGKYRSNSKRAEQNWS